jgi:hypothetical protein
MNAHILNAAGASALETKQKHWALIRNKLKQKKSIETPTRPVIRSINDYPIGRFENLSNSRLEWVQPNYFEFIPKKNDPFTFVRSTKERITPKNFFTDGGSIPRLFRWSDELDPFGSLPAYLLHDWEFDLHHCKQSDKTFEDVASILMEALHTLMDQKLITYDTLVFWMIETGINSWVAHDAWDAIPAKCPLPPYRPE